MRGERARILCTCTREADGMPLRYFAIPHTRTYMKYRSRMVPRSDTHSLVSGSMYASWNLRQAPGGQLERWLRGRKVFWEVREYQPAYGQCAVPAPRGSALARAHWQAGEEMRPRTHLSTMSTRKTKEPMRLRQDQEMVSGLSG